MFLIAEAGVNHGGKLDEAYKLADAAQYAGADAVKFQLFKSQKLWGDDRIKHLELSFYNMEKIYWHCQRIGIEFMCTPFGVEELTFLQPMLKRVKIASGMTWRLPFLDAVNETKLPVIMSTGMNQLGDIDLALKCFSGDVTLLQCTSSYPCRLEDVNLRGMEELAEYGLPVGLSDHTTSITVPLAAVALGAVVIEKHFTLDRNQVGPDHKASIEPLEFKAMKLGIIEVEAALGDGVKRVLPCEVALRAAWRGN